VASLDRPGAFTSLDFALDRLADKGGPFLTSARTAAIRSSVPAANFAPTRSGHRFPLTVGRLENNPVLLDGYHRAASFWRSAPKNASISAYVPTFLATSQ
jgi:hypothetical protein